MLGGFTRKSQAPDRRMTRAALAIMAALSLSVVGILGMPVARVAAVVNLDPVADWALDDGSGTTASDATSGGNDGVVSGGTAWIAAGAPEGSGAIALDGVDGEVRIPNAPALEPGDLAFSAWVRGDPVHPPQAGAPIVEKGAFGCAGPSFGLYVTSDGIGLTFTNPVDLVYTPTIASASAHVANLWDGEWHLVGAAIPVSDGGPPSISIDGAVIQVVGSGGSNHDPVIKYSGATASDLVIGGPVTAGCGAPHFHGDVDDVRLFESSVAISHIGEQMAAETLVITIDPIPDSEVGQFVAITAHVSPMPRFGGIDFELAHQGSQVFDFAANGTADWNAGTFSASIRIIHADSYTVRAVLVARAPYLPASGSAPWDVAPMSTTTSLGVTPTGPDPNASFTLRADVLSAGAFFAFEPYPQGSVDFVETTGGGESVLGSAPLVPWDDNTSRATLAIPGGLGVGTHLIVARYVGPDEYRANSESVPYTLGISTAGTAVAIFGPGPTETHHAIVMSAAIQAPIGGWADGATMDFTAVGSSAPGCAGVPVDPGNMTVCSIPSLPVGHYQYQASYSGNALLTGSTSPLLDVDVTPDTVHATGVGVAHATFYPYKDGYLDTDSIRGTRTEPLSVAIRIYSSSGKLVRSASYGRSSGSYSFTWNGRSSSGTALASGRYKVVQTLTDAAGTHRAYTTYVTISSKRLYYSTKTFTKTGASYSAKFADLPPGTAYGYAFSLPSATVYKAITVKIQGKSPVPPATYGAQDFTRCHLVVDLVLVVFRLLRQLPAHRCLGLTLGHVVAIPLRPHIAGRSVRITWWQGDHLQGGDRRYVRRPALTLGSFRQPASPEDRSRSA